MPEDPPVGLVVGTAQLGTTYGVANRTGRMADEAAIRFVRRAAEAGVRAFDTAPGYGSAERLIGAAGVPTPVFTKLDPLLDPSESVSRSLERLERRRIDLLQLHDESQLLDQPLMEAMRALLEERVDALGASVYDPEAFHLAMEDGSFEYVQVPVNVLDRRFRGTTLTSRPPGRMVLARSVFLQGSLLMRDEDVPEHLAGLSPVIREVDRIAAEAGRSRHELLLVFVRDLPGVDGVLVGCDTLGQLESSIAAFRAVPLDDAIRFRLDALPEVDPAITDPRAWPAPWRPPRAPVGP